MTIDWEHGPVRSRPGPPGTAGAVAAGAGLVLVAAGTFLPWFRSGVVLRNSYEVIGLLRTIGLLDGGPFELALAAWTMTIPMITLCVAAYALGFRRTAATLTATVAIICGTVGGIAAVESGNNRVIAGLGPMVVFVGGVVALIGVVGMFIGRRRGATVPGGEP
ncbi:MAG TPA: hypothetical protein VFV67_31680 [Actinophytocola sp.]|uniref:hypothetical protein n=1 Tax=Actinophytocola sp. TaxID=1872138 RepID=UPI002DB9CF21|nr:hypothetical protein [Actinophytocola sp.]HEU5475228.1 hypothetical protein [Actinophytocola sp.]